MADVFISYQRAEREAVQIIVDRLAGLKLDVWFDTKLNPGGSFDEEIAQAIKDAKAVLTCWTPAALASEWVRGEATLARKEDRLVACFLEPTELIPPFNLTHAEDLCAWAGQEDDPAWLKVLERIGDLVYRPGVASFNAVMRPGATLQELRAWATANGADPLVEAVWARVAAIEGEDAQARLEREKQEALVLGQQRKAQAARSRELARQRGLRDPKRERRRWLALVGVIVAVGLVSAGGLGYVVEEQRWERQLRDDANTPAEVRKFISAKRWLPVASVARGKLTVLDAEAWRVAASSGSIEALEGYLLDASQEPQGQFLKQAQTALQEAKRNKAMQEKLRRLRLYAGPSNGAFDTATREAVKRFRYRWMLPVSDKVDDMLLQRLDDAIVAWTQPRLDELVVQKPGVPTDEDYMRIAEKLGIDAATLQAVIEVEAAGSQPAFREDGRPTVLFEGQVFSRLTKHQFDTTNPAVSYPKWDRKKYPQEYSGRWRQIEEAYTLAPDAALKATSWGRFQIMGENHKASGFETVGEFVRFMAESESNQLEAILSGFILNKKLGPALQARDWEQFVRRYSGLYQVDAHAERLRQAYERRLALMPGAKETVKKDEGN